MTPQEAIALLKEHDANTRWGKDCPTRSLNKAARDQRKSARKVLAAMLGREPTEEELEEATKG